MAKKKTEEVLKETDTRTGEPEAITPPASAQNGTVANATLKPASQGSDNEAHEKTRSEMMAIAMSAMGGMETGDLSKFLEGLKMNTGAAQSGAVDGDQAKNRASITPKGDAITAMKEDVVAMFAGQELSEDLVDKAVTIFEAAVHARVELENARLVEEYDKQLDEAVTEVQEEVATRVDEYLNYVVEEWIKENEVAIDSQIQTDITKSFMKGLKKLFKEHYIKVPKKKLDVVEELVKENEKLTEQFNTLFNENVELKKQTDAKVKPEIVEEVSIGLSDLQKTKFKTLAESVDVNLPTDQYKRKLTVIREHYFKPAAGSTELVLSESVVKTEAEIAAETKGNTEKTVVAADPSVKNYVDAISRTNKRI